MGDITAEQRAKLIADKADVEYLRGEPYQDVLDFAAAQLRDHSAGAYRERAHVLALACKLLRQYCVAFKGMSGLSTKWGAFIGQHPAEDLEWEKEWRTVVFLQLPTGQASWHVHDDEKHLFSFLPAFEGKWDGHSTAEKYARVERYCKM